MDSRLLIRPGIPTPDLDLDLDLDLNLDLSTPAPWNVSSGSPRPHRLLELPPATTTVSMDTSHHFPTVDVPGYVHYTIGVVILAVGITGMLGNFLVIYAFSKSRGLRTPSNIFIINLAITDFLMCLTQTPIFFISSMHKQWIFGKKACELYAFCGALFGICSMMTLMVIAVDRYVVITRPLASLGVMSHRKALLICTAAWVYSAGWSLPPFFGWSAYVPEGLMTSCSWDYMTFTPSVRSYTMLLFTFVFFIPLSIIIVCYFCIFRAIRHTTRAIAKISCETRDSAKKFHKMKNEWRMAKIALIVILLFVISWAPYSCAALTAFAGYADLLTPYMNSIPAVIAKASAIHNPIIYAITHPKYRSAISRYVPYLGVFLCVTGRDRFTSSSFQSTRRSTLASQSDGPHPSKAPSSISSESAVSDTEEDSSTRTPALRQVSVNGRPVRHASQRSKVKGYNSVDLLRKDELTISHLCQATSLTQPEDISMSDISVRPSRHLPAAGRVEQTPPCPRPALKDLKEATPLRPTSKASVIVTSISSPSIMNSQPGFHGNLKVTKTCSPIVKEPLEIARLETTALP